MLILLVADPSDRLPHRLQLGHANSLGQFLYRLGLQRALYAVRGDRAVQEAAIFFHWTDNRRFSYGRRLGLNRAVYRCQLSGPSGLVL